MFPEALAKVAVMLLFSTLAYFSQDDAHPLTIERGGPVADDEVVSAEQDDMATDRGLSGLWALEWDDAIDGKLGDGSKSCDIRLRVIDQELVGYFDGPVLGEQREAVFLGTVYGDTTPLLMFTQREKGYTCSYHIYWNPGEAGPPVGTWHDSRGGSGEFSLLKYQ